MSSSELAYLSIRQVGGLLRRREISPVELTTLSLQRLDEFGPALNAIVTLTEDVALREAALAESELLHGRDRGPLHGIPYGLKDIVAVPGAPTTWGAAPFRHQVLDVTGTVARKLRDAGAILTAKLATVELAGGMGYDYPDAAFTGPTRNPWDLETWTGGSSSGPAAATAAGLVAFSIGSDTGGSIVMPAAWTGTSGLRPTYGRVSRFGAMALAWSLDRLGPICRTAEDCGLVLDAIAGRDALDPTTLLESYTYSQREPRRANFRIGVPGGSWDGVEAEVEANFRDSVEALSAVGVVESFDFPPYPCDEVYELIIAAESYSAFDDFLEAGRSSELSAAKAHGHRLAASVLPAHDYLRAQRIRRKIIAWADALTPRFDAVVAPTLATVASGIAENFGPRLGSNLSQQVNLIGVLAGLPTLSIPNGFGRGGLPTALHLMGAPLAENAILDVARAVEIDIDWPALPAPDNNGGFNEL